MTMRRMKARPFWTAIVAFAALASFDLLAAQGRGVPGGVAFFSARDGNNEIYVMDWDGRRWRRDKRFI